MDRDANIANARQISEQIVDYLTAGAGRVEERIARAFVKLLHKTFNKCTNENVQLCKAFILSHVKDLDSSRMAKLFEYFISLSKTFAPQPRDWRLTGPDAYEGYAGLVRNKDGSMQQPPLSAAKRLHVVYLLHDVLFVERQGYLEFPAQGSVWELMASEGPKVVRNLFELAACVGLHPADQPPAQMLHKLIKQWRATELFTTAQLDEMTSMANSVNTRPFGEVLNSIKLAQDQREEDRKRAEKEKQKWILPDKHGLKDDPDAPWHELPAANGLFLGSTRGFPLHAAKLPAGGFAIEGGGKEADEGLKKDVDSVLSDMLHAFDPFTDAKAVLDIDPLGNKVWKDPERATRNHYGFTLDGVHKMEAQREKFAKEAIGYDVMPSIPGGPRGGRGGGYQGRGGLRGGRGGFRN